MAKTKDEETVDKKQLMKEYLESETKVTVVLPIINGEYPEERVCINDNVFWVKRGEPVEVPKSVADVLMEKLRAEGKLSQLAKKYEETGHTGL